MMPGRWMVGIAAAVLLLGGCKAKSRTVAGPTAPREGDPAASRSKPELVVRAGRTIAKPAHPAASVFTIAGRSFGDDFEKLTQAIAAEGAILAGKGAEPTVIRIIADAGVPYSQVAFLLSAAAQCGLKRARLVAGGMPATAASQTTLPLEVDLALPPPRPRSAYHSNPYEWTTVDVSRTGRHYSLRDASGAVDSKMELEAALRQRRLEDGDSAAVCVEGDFEGTPVELTMDVAALATSLGFAEVSLSSRITGQGREKEHSSPFGDPPSPSRVGLYLLDEADRIVYVFDGLTADSPQAGDVRIELIRSISRLSPPQEFAILRMGPRLPDEGPERALIPRDRMDRETVMQLARAATTPGPTALLPSLQRAFEILRPSKAGEAGKLILLFTNGAFANLPDGSACATADGRRLRGDEAVIQWVRENNKDKTIRISAILAARSAPSAIKVLKTITQETGGKYKRIRWID